MSLNTLILTQFTPEQDSRANRLVAFIRAAGGTCEVIGVSESVDSSCERRLTGSTLHPQSRMRQRWRRYLRTWSVLRARSRQADQVIAVNCEIGLLTWLYRISHGNRFRLVLDVYDHHGDVFESRLLSVAFSVLEVTAALLAGRVVLPIRERLAQYPSWSRSAIASKALFISNVGFELPRSSSRVTAVDANGAAGEQHSLPEAPLRIVYCGNVDYSRGLDVLLSAVDRMAGRVELTVHGGGVALDAFRQLPTIRDSVHFKGPFRNADLADLARGHDLFWAAYDLRVRNNRYCDPNKFRDHIIADMPLVTNPGHPLASLVEKSGSGFLVPLEVVALQQFMASLTPEAIGARRPSRVGADAVLLSVIDANRASGRLAALQDGVISAACPSFSHSLWCLPCSGRSWDSG